ncbi:MAG: hypothetical protein D3908_15580, partial [Candidatus Electrothrix sp. AUS4]|nr:hypothetical protein [Candidatus Electrothrix sp. AUS4]
MTAKKWKNGRKAGLEGRKEGLFVQLVRLRPFKPSKMVSYCLEWSFFTASHAVNRNGKCTPPGITARFHPAQRCWLQTGGRFKSPATIMQHIIAGDNPSDLPSLSFTTLSGGVLPIQLTGDPKQVA